MIRATGSPWASVFASKCRMPMQKHIFVHYGKSKLTVPLAMGENTPTGLGKGGLGGRGKPRPCVVTHIIIYLLGRGRPGPKKKFIFFSLFGARASAFSF